MNNRRLQHWFNTLSLEDRLAVQIFVLRLYGMEINEND